MTHTQVAEAYRRYGALVLRRCKRIVRDEALAEDALQDAFVKLWRYGDSFLAADAPLLWLYRTAERCCFDLLSRRSARAEQPLESAVEPAAHGSGHGQALEDRDVIFHFLRGFDDRVKQVAVLHYLDGMTQEAIAAETGWSRQTIVKKLEFLHDEATRLRKTLDEAKKS